MLGFTLQHNITLQTLPREVILAIASMKTIHRTGLTSQAVVRRCSLKSGALKNFTNFSGKQLLEPFLIKLLAFRLEACNFFQTRLHRDLHGVSNAGVFL